MCHTAMKSAVAFVAFVSAHRTNKDGNRIERVSWDFALPTDAGDDTVKFTLSATGQHVNDDFGAYLAIATLPFAVRVPRKVCPTSTVNGINVTRLLSGSYLPAQLVRDLFGVSKPVDAAPTQKPAKKPVTV